MTDIRNTVDQLGQINAEIALLEASARKLKNELIQQGAGVYEGNSYFADVQYFDSQEIKPDLVRKLVAPELVNQVTVTRENKRVVVKQLPGQQA
jgi:hypothetical protein